LIALAHSSNYRIKAMHIGLIYIELYGGVPNSVKSKIHAEKSLGRNKRFKAVQNNPSLIK
jgi:hypothetical protein